MSLLLANFEKRRPLLVCLLPSAPAPMMKEVQVPVLLTVVALMLPMMVVLTLALRTEAMALPPGRQAR